MQTTSIWTRTALERKTEKYGIFYAFYKDSKDIVTIGLNPVSAVATKFTQQNKYYYIRGFSYKHGDLDNVQWE